MVRGLGVLGGGHDARDTISVDVSTVTQVDRASPFALRHSNLDFGLGGQRS